MGSLRSQAGDRWCPGLLAVLSLSKLQLPHLHNGDRAVLRVGDSQGTRQGGVSSSSTHLLGSPPRNGPANYSHTPPTHWVPPSGPGTVACGEPFCPHPTHFSEEETGSGEAVQLTVRSAGWGHSHQDVPAPPKCRGAGHGGRGRGAGGGRPRTAWRDGSEPELRALKLTVALQGRPGVEIGEVGRCR